LPIPLHCNKSGIRSSDQDTSDSGGTVAGMSSSAADDAAQFTRAWGESERLTPRQARAIAAVLEIWGDEIRTDWIDAGPRRTALDTAAFASRPPLHDIAPFDGLDLRVLVLVDENAAWAAAAAERCHAVAAEIAAGILPFDRAGCFFDELLMALALREAPDILEQIPDLFDGLPERQPPPETETDEDYDGSRLGDDEWDLVSDGFDDACRWDEWEVPAMNGHALLGVVLAEHHPYRWFDPGPGTGSGYLRRLSGLE
jgi:hypothetical protein